MKTVMVMAASVWIGGRQHARFLRPDVSFAIEVSGRNRPALPRRHDRAITHPRVAARANTALRRLE
jgi:hypothetical protein